MDECYLLAAVLMVIGLQLGNGGVQQTTDCRTGAKSSYDQIEGINITNGVHLVTHPPEATFGGKEIRCLMICTQEPDCSIAVMDGNSKECLTYSYNLALGAPVKVIAPTFTSYVKAVGGYFVSVKQDGSITYAKALAECKRQELKLPRTDDTFDLQSIELLLTMWGWTDNYSGHLFWLQAGTTTGENVKWDDGTDAVSKMQPKLCQDTPNFFIDGCSALESFKYDDYGLTISSPSMKINYARRTRQMRSGTTDFYPAELSKYVVCQ